MDGFMQAAALLPAAYRQSLCGADAAAEEIRLRLDRPPTLLIDGRERRFREQSCREEDLLCVLEKASGASLHSVSAALREGYLCAGGVRIGVCGTMLPAREDGASFRCFSSLALRIPHECRGIGAELLPALRREPCSGTLLLSAPGGGKTTLLRELIRRLSDGGLRVGVVDERNELSASDGARSIFDLGAHSDVLVGAPKAEGAMLLLRTMNPQLIAMDEITRREDLDTVMQIVGCGVGIIASAHAQNLEEMRRRPLYRALLESGAFRRAVVIEGSGTGRRYSLRETGL